MTQIQPLLAASEIAYRALTLAGAVAMHALRSIIWFALIIAAAVAVSQWLRSPRAVRVIDQITGVVLIGLGVTPAALPH